MSPEEKCKNIGAKYSEDFLYKAHLASRTNVTLNKKLCRALFAGTLKSGELKHMAVKVRISQRTRSGVVLGFSLESMDGKEGYAIDLRSECELRPGDTITVMRLDIPFNITVKL